ncbi:MAG: hypothetical protein ACYSWU_02555 [Planctomycetota bacterium]|jgi:hypothetical protein
MQQQADKTGQTPPAADQSGVPLAANDVRLSPGGWLVVLVILCGLSWLVPVLWERIEPLEAGPDYRVPFRLGNDYWVYRRHCRQACSRDSTLVVGDSVVWGHYVAKDRTLSAWLNRLGGDDRFVNLGVDGIEPAAMAGLIEYYGADVQGKDVLLHCNLLWMADQRRDLQTSEERAFTHPRLLPQFCPQIPCYEETISTRLGVLAERNSSLLAWATHLRIAYFEDKPERRKWTDFASWTIAHPYTNPADAVTLELPSPDEPPSPRPIAEPWKKKELAPLPFPWVKLETSLQWRFFRQTVETLRARGNRVFVLVGPFNEHMLTPQSLETYKRRKREVEAWLRQEKVAHCVPAALPSEYYADASHPLAEGYRLLAERLLDESFFD